MARKSRKNPIVQEKPAHVGLKVWKAEIGRASCRERV